MSFSDVRPHGYPLLLQAYRASTGGLRHLPAVQVTLYCLSVGFLGLAVSLRAGTVLAGLPVLYVGVRVPQVLFNGVMSDAAFATLLATGAALFLLHHRNGAIRLLLAASLVFGAAAITRTIGYVALGTFWACTLLHHRPLGWRGGGARLAAATLPAILMLGVAATSNLHHNDQFRIGSWGGVSLLGKGLVLATPVPADHAASRFNWIPAATAPAKESLDDTRDLVLKMLMARQYYEYLRWFFVWDRFASEVEEWRTGTGREIEKIARDLALAYVLQDVGDTFSSCSSTMRPCG